LSRTLLVRQSGERPTLLNRSPDLRALLREHCDALDASTQLSTPSFHPCKSHAPLTMSTPPEAVMRSWDAGLLPRSVPLPCCVVDPPSCRSCPGVEATSRAREGRVSGQHCPPRIQVQGQPRSKSCVQPFPFSSPVPRPPANRMSLTCETGGRGTARSGPDPSMIHLEITSTTSTPFV
jgi:hypothetical protein